MAALAGCGLAAPMSGMNAVVSGDVANNDRDAAEAGNCRRVFAEPELHAAIKRELRVDRVNGADVEGRHRAALRVLAREPEGLGVGIPVFIGGNAGRSRNQVLGEVGRSVLRADRTDPVVDVDVTARSDVRAGQERDREVGFSGPETFLRV